MSTPIHVKRCTAPDIRARKGTEPVTVLTAYTMPMARLLDPHMDILLVGDSLGMVLYGMESTLGVTLDMMIAHGKAVMRGSESACVVIDMPFASYQESPEQAYRNGSRVMAETGCGAIKLEGGVDMAPTIEFLTRRSIPVMGHVGLMPQSVNSHGGFKVQGRDGEAARKIVDDAQAVADAGAFSIVIEGVIEPLAREITNAIDVPTIGIGAGVDCDGQVLVTEDLVGLFSEFTPKFVRQYADLGPKIAEAAAAYADDVRARRFPGPAECFGGGPQVSKKKAV